MIIYPKRFEKEPRKRKAYCYAYDLIAIYGAKKMNFTNCDFDLTEDEANEIWSFASRDINGKSSINYIYTWKRRKIK